MKVGSCPLREVSPPTGSALSSQMREIDFFDAYEVPLSQSNLTVEEAYWAIFGSQPAWVRWLMHVRGWVAVRLGLMHPFGVNKTTFAGLPDFQPRCRVGPFTVQSITDQELIVGDDDKHLNFRISAFKCEREGQVFLTVSTAVKIHNNLGHAYMFVVKPFHRLIAPYMVCRAVRSARL